MVQVTNYYLSGLLWATSPEQNADLQPYKFNGCEFIEMGGLDITDLGNRGIYHAISRFTTMDRFCEKVPWQSPYVFAGNNPIRFVDVRGDSITPNSQTEWKGVKKDIKNACLDYAKTADKIIEKAKANGWNEKQLLSALSGIYQAAERLNGVLSTMTTMEGSKQMYSLNSVNWEVGNISRDANSGVITLNYNGTAGFVHEVTHTGQFENGDMAFVGKEIIGQDLYDEVEAYKNQFAYSASSVQKLNAIYSPNTLSQITPEWVQSITTSNGVQPYKYAGINNTGLYPVNTNTTFKDFRKAYPWQAMWGYPDNMTIKSIPGIIYMK